MAATYFHQRSLLLSPVSGIPHRIPERARQLLPVPRHVYARSLSSHQSLRTIADPTAASVATRFLSKFKSLGPQVRNQVLDANQLQLLCLTLNRPSLFPASSPSSSSSLSSTSSLAGNARPPPLGTPLPPGYHLVYFTPAFLESELGADGTDTSYNPDAPFTRRMWAGGEVRWPRGSKDGEVNPLRVGQEVTETTRVLSAEPKVVRKTGEEMIVVGVEKEFRNEYGVAVVDRRNWVFRKALPERGVSQATPAQHKTASEPRSQSASPVESPATKGRVHTRDMVQSAVTLFRFSALTFNPHKIHYSLPWARDVEGHRDIVVHGPLNLINILDLWRDTRSDRASDPQLLLPESISYRATSPLYAGDRYQIVLEDADEGLATVQIFGPDGEVAMKAEVRSARS